MGVRPRPAVRHQPRKGRAGGGNLPGIDLAQVLRHAASPFRVDVA